MYQVGGGDLSKYHLVPDRQTDSLYFSTIKIKALQLVGSCKIIAEKV